MAATPSPITIALLQMDARESAREENRAHVASAAEEAVGAGARLLVLPELWPWGYDLASASLREDTHLDAEWACELSKKHNMAVAGSTIEEQEGSRRNRATLHDKGNLLGSYDKAHLFAPLGEKKHLEPGQDPPGAIELEGLKVGLSICYDLRFPELYRHLSSCGCEVILVVAQWPRERIEHWRALVTARAIEGQCWLVAVNRWSPPGDGSYGGSSMVVSPGGEVVVEATEGEGLHLAVIDVEESRALRREFPVLDDRRPGLFVDS